MLGVLKLMDSRGLSDEVAKEFYLNPKTMGEIELSASMLSAIASHLR